MTSKLVINKHIILDILLKYHNLALCNFHMYDKLWRIKDGLAIPSIWALFGSMCY